MFVINMRPPILIRFLIFVKSTIKKIPKMINALILLSLMGYNKELRRGLTRIKRKRNLNRIRKELVRKDTKLINNNTPMVMAWLR
jgi:hypothetical protein